MDTFTHGSSNPRRSSTRVRLKMCIRDSHWGSRRCGSDRGYRSYGRYRGYRTYRGNGRYRTYRNFCYRQ